MMFVFLSVWQIFLFIILGELGETWPSLHAFHKSIQDTIWRKGIYIALVLVCFLIFFVMSG